MSATFSADALLAIGTDPSASPSARLVALAAERADRTGLACFDTGELCDLMATDASALQDYIQQGYLISGSADAIQLDISQIQPEGFPAIGAKYGELTLVREVRPETWLCRCSCGSARTFRIEYLTSGITSRCNNARKHRQVTA